MPREGGASSTPRLFGSITTVSGILDRPIKSGDDSECVVVREELAAAPGSSGVSSRDGLEEGSDDDTQ
ncbi:hypothetical protein, partial [Bradyrhizobium sp. I1.7.5]|uniref:hypothetical protein n=1 Tax=Bradyrhizobium sp. I1.7.5 TaxID=3156363 RepID=UPI003393A57A